MGVCICVASADTYTHLSYKQTLAQVARRFLHLH